MRAAGLIFIFSIAIFLLSPVNSFSQKQPKIAKIPSIEKVTFESDTVRLACPVFKDLDESFSSCKKVDQNTRVFVRVANPAGDLEYYYTVTGGRIIGKGSDVKWDLDGMRTGEYTVTVGIGRKGVVIGSLVSKTIRVDGCYHCNMPCECTNITEMTEPEGPVKTGDIVVFSLRVTGTVEVKFKWEVEGGVMLSSPDSETAMVKITAKPGEIVNIYANLEGNKEGCNCVNRDGIHIKIEK